MLDRITWLIKFSDFTSFGLFCKMGAVAKNILRENVPYWIFHEVWLWGNMSRNNNRSRGLVVSLSVCFIVCSLYFPKQFKYFSTNFIFKQMKFSGKVRLANLLCSIINFILAMSFDPVNRSSFYQESCCFSRFWYFDVASNKACNEY